MLARPQGRRTLGLSSHGARGDPPAPGTRAPTVFPPWWIFSACRTRPEKDSRLESKLRPQSRSSRWTLSSLARGQWADVGARTPPRPSRPPWRNPGADAETQSPPCPRSPSPSRPVRARSATRPDLKRRGPDSSSRKPARGVTGRAALPAPASFLFPTEELQGCGYSVTIVPPRHTTPPPHPRPAVPLPARRAHLWM